MSDDLVAFLRARIDEDERAAQDVHSEGCSLHLWLRQDVPSVCDCNWPPRVLREVEAKRRILDRFDLYKDAEFPDYEGGYASAIGDVLDLLALAYANHPDYRDEWRP